MNISRRKFFMVVCESQTAFNHIAMICTAVRNIYAIEKNPHFSAGIWKVLLLLLDLSTQYLLPKRLGKKQYSVILAKYLYRKLVVYEENNLYFIKTFGSHH